MRVETQILTSTTTIRLPYLIHLPDEYDERSDQNWPVIMFLHGAGERGNNQKLLKSQGLPKKLEAGDEVPCIVVAPQCPLEDWWSDYRRDLIELLDHVLNTFRVDTSRVYLTGLSMGGKGTWDLATCYPDRFAAIIPICGWGGGLFGYPERLRRITHIPVWAFHGESDVIVASNETQILVDSLREYGGTVKLTLYPDTGHDSWTETYDNPEIYQWLFERRLG